MVPLQPDPTTIPHKERMDSRKLEREMDYMRAFFQAWVARYGSAGPMGALGEWLGSDTLELHRFESVVAKYGASARVEWFVKQRCDLILSYVAARLQGSTATAIDSSVEQADNATEVAAADVSPSAAPSGPGPFDEASAVTVSLVRRLLHINGDDLVRYRPREIAELLAPEVVGYAMGSRAARDTEAHLADVQAALDLGYDWCLRLARPALQKALEAERDRIAREMRYPQELAGTLAEHSDLGTLTRLAEQQRHSLGELY